MILKKLIFMGLTASTATVAPLAAVGSTATASSSNQQTKFNPYVSPVITNTDGLDFDSLEALALANSKKTDPKEWINLPRPKDWGGYDLNQAYWYAAYNGWTPESYREYLAYHFDHQASVEPWKFGFFDYALETFVRARVDKSLTLTKGTSNPARFTWDGSAKADFNQIDNTIPWYSFRHDDRVGGRYNFFTFDDKNVQNGWKRLEKLGNLVKIENPTTEILGEESSKGVKRNHFLVNGKFATISELTKSIADGHKFWKVSAGSDWLATQKGDFVRDDNGWISYVSLSADPTGGDYSKDENVAETKKLNDEIRKLFYYDNTNTLEEQHKKTAAQMEQFKLEDQWNDVTYPRPVINPTNKTYNDSKPGKWKTQRQNGGLLGNGGKGKEIVYPADYTVNDEFSKTNSAGDIQRLEYAGNWYASSSKDFWQGKYTLVQSGKNFDNLLHDNAVVFPTEETVGVRSAGDRHAVYSQFGKPNWTFDVFDQTENGSWFSWAWVEDGHGGHKIYKTSNYETLFARYRAITQDPFLDTFYGSFNYVYPKQEWFHGDKAGWGKI